MSPEFLALQVLNGLTFAALLFLVASGFTLVFGVMRIVNLAHGALYLLGGSIGISVAAVTGSWVLGVVAAGFSVGLVGLFSERVLLHRVRGRELPEVLLTVGIALVIADLILAVFGGNPRSADPPPPLVGGTSIGPVTYPTYRLFVIGLRGGRRRDPRRRPAADADRRGAARRGRRSRDGRRRWASTSTASSPACSSSVRCSPARPG